MLNSRLILTEFFIMKYILSIDAGTTGITIQLFNDQLEIMDKEYSEFTQISAGIHR